MAMIATRADMCAHGNQMNVRLITYTRYGPMVGCLACGTSWLVRDADRPSRQSSAARSQSAASRAS
jgi:hypothetical protein